MGSSLIQIDRERFHKLVTALRTAVANEYKLHKEDTVYNDILDAFRLALHSIRERKINIIVYNNNNEYNVIDISGKDSSPKELLLYLLPEKSIPSG